MDFNPGTYDYFVETITEYRKKHNITQDEFGSPAGLNQKAISKREKHYTQFALEEAISICKEFGLSLDELCGLKSKSSDNSMLYSDILAPIFKAASIAPASVSIETDDSGIQYADIYSPDDYIHPQKYRQAQIVINIPGRYWSEALPEWDRCRIRAVTASDPLDMSDSMDAELSRKNLDDLSRQLLENARNFNMNNFQRHVFMPEE